MAYNCSVTLVQLVKTIFNIRKVWSSNPEHHKKKKTYNCPRELNAIDMDNV